MTKYKADKEESGKGNGNKYRKIGKKFNLKEHLLVPNFRKVVERERERERRKIGKRGNKEIIA
jgi:hypothetical protein